MQVSVETIGTLGRRVTVAVPADRIEKVFADRIRDLAKRVKMPGFRPGKVPLKMIEARYGGSVMDELAGELIDSTFREAVGQEGLRPASGPRIAQKTIERGKDFEYTAEFEVYPPVAMLDIKGVDIERPVATIDDADIDRTIETIRQQRADWRTVDRAVAEGDRATINFVGRLNGEEFKGGRADNFSLVIGSGTLVEDLERGLIGVTAGSARDLNVKFPDDYPHATLRGQSVDFHVEIKEVAEPVLPPVDDTFAKALGIEDGSIDKLRQEVRGNLEREAAGRTRAVVSNQVLNRLLAGNPLELPASLVNGELAHLKAQLPAGGRPVPEQDEGLLARARRRVALGLIFTEIVRARDMKPDAAAVRARIEELAAEYESPQEFVQWHYNNPQRMHEIESAVMEERVVNDLLKDANVTDKPVGFQELLNMVRALERQ